MQLGSAFAPFEAGFQMQPSLLEALDTIHSYKIKRVGNFFWRVQYMYTYPGVTMLRGTNAYL